MTVWDFERDVEKNFGMCVRLYRKSGNSWLEVTITGAWTMKQQDESANEISTFIKKKLSAPLVQKTI